MTRWTVAQTRTPPRGTASVTFEVPVSTVFLDKPLRRLIAPSASSLWSAFAQFLDDGRICLTSNAAERA